MKHPVEGHPNLYKDMETGVIDNREDSERSRYRLAKQQAKANIQNSSDIDDLREEIDELKSLIQQLLNK